MTAAKYRPRDFLAPGVKFGANETVAPRLVAGLEDTARMRASLRQSNWSFLVRRRMELDGVALADLANEMGVTYDRLGKVLRGFVIMTLVDFELANTALDLRARRRQESDDAVLRKAAADREERAHWTARDIWGSDQSSSTPSTAPST